VSARPPRLPFSATHVVKACVGLTPAEKLTWVEHYALDNGPDGCFVGAGGLAARLGFTRHTVEAHRRRFVDAGLLVKAGRGAGRTDSWFPTLPPQCTPSGPRLTTDHVALLADRLDLRLRTLKGSPRRTTMPTEGRFAGTTMPNGRAQLGTTMYHSGIPPCPTNPAEPSTKRHTAVPTQPLTVGEAGEAGEAGEGEPKTVSQERAAAAAPEFDDDNDDR